jgi:hypothetical protein
MKKPAALLLSLATLSAGLLLAGCDTFESRAREKSETYNSLPPNTQQRLERGTVNPGDTEDMVYIALGDPDEQRDVTSTDSKRSIWIYRTYWQQYEGSAWVGWHRVIVRTPRGYAIYHEPITQSVYRTHIDEIIRVTFVDGKVTTVEQSKRT